MRDNNPVLYLEQKFLLHEDNRTGGLGGEPAALIGEHAFEDLDGPVVRLTAPDTPMPFSPARERVFLPQAEDLIRSARRLADY
jgi:2-oxoisovalerate dehydrogenase E1 component beta subunit